MNELVTIENGEIKVAEEIINKITNFEKAKKEIEYQEKILKEGLMEAMNKVGIKKFIINGLSATIKDGTTRTTIDSKRLKAEAPEIYEAYSQTSEVKSSISLSVAD